MQKYFRRSGFTLIEMLVVVVIIGILAGALIPRLVGAKERASDSGRLVKVGQISSAVELYAQETGSPYPIATLTGAPGISIATPSVANAIAPYLSTIPTDPGKGTVAISSFPGNIQVTGDSFAYWTNTGGTIYAITALMESKKGNTTNATAVIDSDKQGGYQVVGKGLTTSITSPRTAGVYYEGNNIVVTDGTTTYTIANMNVGATQVGTDGTNAAIRGSYFQRGNNFGFTTVGTVTPNTTTLFDTSTYGGSNIFSSPTWIYGMGSVKRYDWSITQNDNLRPAGTQGPCPTGYHVPTNAEWGGLVNVRASLPGKTIYSLDFYAEFNNDLFSIDLKLPKAGIRYYDSAAGVYDQGDVGYYWSSTPNVTYAYRLVFFSSTAYGGSDGRAGGFSMRCFKN